jgi:hypothetical protein
MMFLWSQRVDHDACVPGSIDYLPLRGIQSFRTDTSYEEKHNYHIDRHDDRYQ